MDWRVARPDGTRRELWEAAYLATHSEGPPPSRLDRGDGGDYGGDGYGDGYGGGYGDGYGYGYGRGYGGYGDGYGDGGYGYGGGGGSGAGGAGGGGGGGSGAGGGGGGGSGGGGDGDGYGSGGGGGEQTGGHVIELKTGEYVVVVAQAPACAVPEIFGGEFVARDVPGRRILLRNARQATYYDRTTRSYTGLGAFGPGPDSRIAPATPEIEIGNVTHVQRMTEVSRARWEAEPWQ